MVFPLLRQFAGVMESMKSQTPSTKFSNLKFQYSMTKNNRNFDQICLIFVKFGISTVFQTARNFTGKAIELCPPQGGIRDWP